MAELNAMLQAAIWYAELGYPVLPCAPGRKTPLTKHGLLDAVFIPHAAPGGSLERLCRECLVVQASCLPKEPCERDQNRLEARTTIKPFWTLDHQANAGHVAIGARALCLDSLQAPAGRPML